MSRMLAELFNTTSERAAFANYEEKEQEEMLVEENFSTGQIVVLVYLLVAFLAGATANTSALLTFFRKSSLRTTSNRYQSSV